MQNQEYNQNLSREYLGFYFEFSFSCWIFNIYATYSFFLIVSFTMCRILKYTTSRAYLSLADD